MIGKKTLRLTTAALLAGATLGAQQVSAHRAADAGTVAITDWQFPAGCNQIADASVADQEICQPMESSLFLIDDKLNYQADLAANIPTTKNGGAKIVNGNLVVTYKIKPNQKWSDGVAFTVDDIIFSVNATLAAGQTTGLDQIANMQKVDNNTLRVTYKGVYAPYIAYGTPTQLFPQHYLTKKYGTTDIKTIGQKLVTDLYNTPNDVFIGPYKLQSYTNGQSIVTVPNPGYTALSAPNGRLAQLKFVNIAADATSLVSALKSPNAGVDKAEDFQPSDLPALAGSKYRITSQPALFVEHLELDQNGPLKDIRLRQALQYSINKLTLFKALFPAVPNPSDFILRTVLPNSSPFADKSAPPSQYDPAKAKALLKAAGYSTDYNGAHPLTLRFATTTSSTRQRAFQIISRYAAAVGIHMTPTFASGSPSANNGLFSPYSLNGVLTQRRFDVALFAFSESPDPQQSESNFNPALIPTAAANHHAAGDQNYTGVADQDQFSLLSKAGHVLDAGQRQSLLNKWQTLVNQRTYWIMLYARSNITADNRTIPNYRANPSQQGNEWNAYEWGRAR